MLSRLIGFVFAAIVPGSVLLAQTTISRIAEPPIGASERVRWLMRENVSPAALLDDVAAGAEQTLGHVVRMTFIARDRTGNTIPAYARFLAIPGSSFLADTWMPDGQASAGDAAVRTGMGFLSRMGENAWRELRPRR